MRIIQKHVFTAAELKKDNPSLFKKAHERWNEKTHDIAWQDEIFESLKGIIEHSGLRLANWDLGLCNRRNGIKVSFSGKEEGTEELKGKRAFAWIENNLFGKLRPSWKYAKRWEKAKYNASYRSCHPAGSDVLFSYFPGVVPPCPFTGYCADDSYIDALKLNIKQGRTLKEAYEDLADTYVELLEAESDYQQSEEYFLDTCETNGYEFDEDGDII
jgi:hypothetical protein